MIVKFAVEVIPEISGFFLLARKNLGTQADNAVLVGIESSGLSVDKQNVFHGCLSVVGKVAGTDFAVPATKKLWLTGTTLTHQFLLLSQIHKSAPELLVAMISAEN